MLRVGFSFAAFKSGFLLQPRASFADRKHHFFNGLPSIIRMFFQPLHDGRSDLLVDSRSQSADVFWGLVDGV